MKKGCIFRYEELKFQFSEALLMGQLDVVIQHKRALNWEKFVYNINAPAR